MMDYESQQQNNTSHISYKDYKKILKTNKKQGLKLFLGAFFVLLLIFLGFAKMMSPDVDITLGDEPVYEEDDDSRRGEVDDRLRELQMEDESATLGDESLNVEDGEKVSIPVHNRETEYENKLPEETLGQKAVKDVVGDTQPKPVQKPKDQTVQPQPQTAAPAPAPAPALQTMSAKVIVGSYPTLEQAEVAKGILQEAGLGVTPFVRKFNGAYTLQVASYATREKALSVAESLLNQNFPAKVIVEYK